MRKPSPCRYLALATACLWTGAKAQAPVEEQIPARYVLGLSLSASPEYAGSGGVQLKLRPLWAYQYGRLRISTSRAGSLLGFGGESSAGPGASSELLATDRWKFGAALRVDSGRQPGDSDKLRELPEIRRTVRVRFYGNYTVDSNWNLSTSVSQDLLGRGGGAVFGLDAGYHQPLSPRTTWTAGAGVNVLNTVQMKLQYGIAEADAARSGLRAYSPRGGLQDVHAGVGITSALSSRWITFASLGVSRLLGDAADSPLTENPTSVSASVGLAWRCCK